jgi:hypothetical protein
MFQYVLRVYLAKRCRTLIGVIGTILLLVKDISMSVTNKLGREDPNSTTSHLSAQARADAVAHNGLPAPSVSMGALLFYNSANRQVATGRLSANGTYQNMSVSDPGAFAPWTHIVGAGNDALLFYNSGYKQAATGKLSANGTYQNMSVSDPGAFSSWTHIVGAGNGALLFYNSAPRQVATGKLSADGTYQNMSVSDPGAFSSWTHIVGGEG